MKKIVLTGGGTAGHVYPAIAVWENIKNEYKTYYIGSNGMEKDIIKNFPDIKFYQINAVKLQRKLTLSNLLIPFKLLSSIRQAKKILKKIKPNVIFSKGGFVAVPVVIAAHKLGIPVISHESDLSLGLANKIILRYCNKMCTSFEKTALGNSKCVYTGQPIRKLIYNGNKNNLNFLGLFDKKKPNLLIVGGSSGAKFLNEIVWKNLDKITEKFNVIHITGKSTNQNVTHSNYKQVNYAENMGDYLNFADYILSRAGSGAINEFLSLNKPMLLIPLSKKCSRGDQIENAKLFKNLGIADMLEEEDYEDELFLIKLNNLIDNKNKFKENMTKIALPNPCKNIINEIKKVELK